MNAFPVQPDPTTQPPVAFSGRVVHVQHSGANGRMIAELDKHRDEPWPAASFGVESIWQLLSFYLTLRGLPGNALPLGCKEISCLGQLRAHHTCLRYEITVTLVSQLPQSGASIAVGNGVILADNEPIFSVHEAQVASFSAIQPDPAASSSHPRATTGSSESAGVSAAAIAV